MDSPNGNLGHALLLVLVWLLPPLVQYPNLVTSRSFRLGIPHRHNAIARPDHIISLGDADI